MLTRILIIIHACVLGSALAADPNICDPERLLASIQSHLKQTRNLQQVTRLGDWLATDARRHGHTATPELVHLLEYPLRIFELPAAARKKSSWLEQFEPSHLMQSACHEQPCMSDESDLPVATEALIDAMHRGLLDLHRDLDQVLGSISPSEIDALRQLLPNLLDRSSNGSDLEQLENGEVMIPIAASIDHGDLTRIAEKLQHFAAPELARALRESLMKLKPIDLPDWLAHYVAGPILLARQTSLGPILVGGAGANRYTGQALMIIDISGNDEYLLNAPGQLRVMIDMDGNDRYVSLADAGPAGAILGASLIADHAGDDEYIGGRVALGATVAGIGMLYDFAGNDRYTAQELAQGAALAGIGALMDRSGDDFYHATRFAQGFGGAAGTGMLVDHAGDDHYFAGGKHASSYGVKNRHQAFSQGVGMGFRNDLPGGLGLLLDHDGDDVYQAGNLAQATGYYFGRGVLLDAGGNDRYLAGRYAQGTAAHLGTGLLFDRQGNDFYQAYGPASQAAAWDQAVAAMIDCGGKNRYEAGEFALGAAAHNAMAMFISIDSHNHFNHSRDARAHVGPNDYHQQGKHLGSVAIFLDGDDQDQVVIRHNGKTTEQPAQ